MAKNFQNGKILAIQNSKIKKFWKNFGKIRIKDTKPIKKEKNFQSKLFKYKIFLKKFI